MTVSLFAKKYKYTLVERAAGHIGTVFSPLELPDT
eukprot:SAG31_NODE_705_length_12695_cov_3.147007_5_plen_35_part_00